MRNLILLGVLMLTISTTSAGTYIAAGVQHGADRHTEGFFTVTQPGTVTLDIRNGDGEVVVGSITYEVVPFQTIHWDTREWGVFVEGGSITISTDNAYTFVPGHLVVKLWGWFTSYTSSFRTLFQGV